MQTLRHLPTLLPTLTLALLSFAGCDTQDLQDADDPSGVLFRPGGWGCSHCGIVLGNSPNINGAALSDIHLDTMNTAGVKLRLGTSPDNHPFVLDVDPDSETFRALNPALLDEVMFAGSDFVGAKIALEMPGAIGVTLVITDIDEEVMSWSADGSPMTAYRAEYMGGGGQYKPLCPSTSAENQWFTLITGEIYDRPNSQPGFVGITTSPRSVTIACVGEAAAKMKLMDFHPLGNRRANQDERLATLRMITGDYCGDGTSYTETGVPVAWRDDQDTILPPTEENVLEAMWTSSGARCLDTPRVVERDTIHCEIPLCDNAQEFDSGDTWRTMLPGE